MGAMRPWSHRSRRSGGVHSGAQDRRMNDPPTGASLSRVVRVSIKRPGLTIGVCLTLALAGLVVTARHLTFQTSSVELLPPHHIYVQRFKEYLRDFGELNDIVIAIEAPSPSRAEVYADRLATEIKRLPGAGRVAYRVDPDLFAGQALLYLSTPELDDLADKIRLHRPFIERYAARPTLAELLDAIGDEIARRLALGFVDLGLDGGGTEKVDAGFVDALLGVVAEGVEGVGVGASPWARVFTSAAEHERSGYFFSADDRLLFLLVEPRREAANFTDNELFIAAIRGAIRTLRATYPDVAAGATGTPALSNDEMLTAFRDSTMATLLAVTLTVGALFLVMRCAVVPLVMTAVLLASLAWSLGIITATVGHLTVFSVMFISLLIGIGIDYGVYLFFRYEEELGLGRTPQQALDATAAGSGPGILFGALAAAGTFGVLMLTEFRGIQEFGFVAGIAILMAFIAMLTLFPPLLVSVLTPVPADPDAKIAAVRRLAPLVADVHLGHESAVDVAAIRTALATLRHRLTIAAVEAEGRTAAATLRSARDRADALLGRLQRGDAELASRLAQVQASLRDDFAAKLGTLQDNLAPRHVAVRELPPELTRKFIGASGRLLMLIYPAIDTWDRDGAREFVRQLRSVDAAVTGSPLISYEASRLVEAAYWHGTLYAAALVAVLAVVVLRRPLDAVLALVPMALGTLWTIGFMPVLGLSFNLANVWGLPLIIGASAEYGLNVVLRYREQTVAGGVPFPRSGILAVVLNGLTTMAGFGSLMVARHQGIFGLGLFLTIGTAAALASSLLLLPTLLRLVDRAFPPFAARGTERIHDAISMRAGALRPDLHAARPDARRRGG